MKGGIVNCKTIPFLIPVKTPIPVNGKKTANESKLRLFRNGNRHSPIRNQSCVRSDLLRVCEDLDEIPGDGAVGVRVVEGRRPARVAHAARPPDPVHVLVGRLWGMKMTITQTVKSVGKLASLKYQRADS